MAHLPTPGGDRGIWGSILNDFLSVSLNGNGTMRSSSLSSAGAEMIVNKGQANGYASLNSSGIVPTSQLPAAVVTAAGDYIGVYADSLTMTSNDYVQVPFDGITTQNGTSLNWTSDTSDFISIVDTGVYSITATIDWQDSGATGALSANIRTQCDFNVTDQRGAIGDDTTDSIQCLSATLYLQTGEDIELNLVQITGASLTPYITVLVTRCA